MPMKLRFLYFIIDGLPTFRPDIAALWGKYLPLEGVSSDIVTLRTFSTIDDKALWPAGNQLTIARRRNAMINGLNDFAHDCLVLFRVRRENYDAIQLRDKTFVGIVALAIARWRGLPFFYWMSFPYGPSLLELARTDAVRRNLPRRFYLWWRGAVGDWLLHTIVLPRADHVFVQSDRMSDDLADRGINRARMTAVPMCIDPDRFPGVLPLASLPDVPPGSRIIGYLGEASKARKMEFLLEAVALARVEVPHLFLVIVGDAILPQEQVWLRSCIASSGLSDCCRVTGWVSPDTATATLAAAEICLALMPPDPILDSTTPTKLVEYLAMGRPVVANDHPDQTLVINTSGAGLVAPYTVAGYAAAIVHLLAMRDQHPVMAKRGREFVLAERAYPAMAARLAARYRQLLSGRSS